MTGDSGAAVEFLKLLYPDGPWVLTAINKGKGRNGTVRGAAFHPGGELEMRAWIDDFNGSWNIYYSANEVIDPNVAKSSKNNIRAVHYFYVDLDPEAGENLEEQRKQILNKLKRHDPEPNFIIFSGGGYQALWRLREPIRIDGDTQLAADAELYNIGLEKQLGADHCHNVDRILRLPGTVNVPDEKKLAKGRKRELASVVHSNTSVWYDKVVFPKGQRTYSEPKVGGSVDGIDLPESVKRLDGVQDLDKWNVPDRVKVIIVQGKHPDETKEGDNSRSAWLFDVVCNLLRCNVPDEVVYSVITDPDFLISESVLEKDSPRNYATKQLRSAKEFIINPDLKEMNERYFVIGNEGRICHVSPEGTLVRQDASAFKLWLENRFVEIGHDKNGNPKREKMAKWWLEHPRRRQYEMAVFRPGCEVHPSLYNLWKGWAVKAAPGDCQLYLDHVKNVICDGDDKKYSYLIQWMANAVQNPNSPGQVAVVVKGDRGTGKGILVHSFGKLFGNHYKHISNAEQLVGKFNGHLEQCCLLFCDEAFYAGDKRHESVLKALVTEELVAIERKGVDMSISRNVLHLMMASNEEWVVPAGTRERRFFVLQANNQHIQDKAYFGAIVKQMNNGGYEALLHHLLEMDLSGFEVRDVPRTAHLADQEERTMDSVTSWWLMCIQEASIGRFGWPESMPKVTLYETYLKGTNSKGRQISHMAFGKKMSELANLKTVKRCYRVRDSETGALDTRNLNGYLLPPVGLCRERFCEVMQGDYEWPEVPEAYEDFKGPF